MPQETYQDCSKCGEEIVFEIEHISADDGEWDSAGMIATELQPDCHCSFSDDEIDQLEEKATSDYNDF